MAGEASTPNAAAPIRILVVDDHKESRNAVAKYLTVSGFSVTEASNGETAIRALRTGPPFRFLLTDLNLPDVDGFEVARLARQITKGIWIALVTGWSFDTEDADDYGIDQVFFKPLKLADLITTLKKEVERTTPA